jgi:hypothetical protein
MNQDTKLQNLMAMARKSIYGEKLIPFTIKLRRDQVEYLKKLENASEWLRSLIDKEIASRTNIEQATTKSAVVKILMAKQEELNRIINNPFYQEAPTLLKAMKNTIKHLKKAKTVEVKTTLEWAQGGLFVDGAYAPCWTDTNIPKTFIIENNLEFNKPIPKDKIPLLTKQLKAHYNLTKTIFEDMRQKVKELRTEIKQLQQKLGNT